MKVPAPPTSTVGVERPRAPAGSETAGQTERGDAALQEDADLFKQAMSDTAKEPAGATRRGATSGASAGALQGEPGKTRARGSGTAAERADAFRGEPGRAREGGAAALTERAAAFRGELGKAPESGGETAAAGADKKGTAGAETRDETRAEAGVDAQQELQQQMAAQVMQARTAAPAPRAEAAAPPAISSEVVADVAQRILVSAGEHGQDKEVRIQVKDTVLNDTEVVIARQQGELVVVFETRSHTDNVLLGNSRDAMTAALQEALDGPVRIDINAETPDTDPRDRHDRRSRGMYVQDDDA